MEIETFECPACHEKFTIFQFMGGTCEDCAEKGFWIDPAGGLHFDDPNSDEFEDPAAIWE